MEVASRTLAWPGTDSLESAFALTRSHCFVLVALSSVSTCVRDVYNLSDLVIVPQLLLNGRDANGNGSRRVEHG